MHLETKKGGLEAALLKSESFGGRSVSAPHLSGKASNVVFVEKVP